MLAHKSAEDSINATNKKTPIDKVSFFERINQILIDAC
jgi:hypothetical protein